MLVNSAPNVLVGCMDALKKGGAARWSRRMTWSVLVLSTILVSSYAHVKAGFTLPIPWNDEPWYAWSSISLAENNTFFSESLNPERVLPLIPMYQVPLAIFFKATGFSFSLARWVSWAFMAMAYVGVLWLVKSRPLPFVSAAVSSLFFLGASSVVAGNMVRPEAMVWAFAVWSFVLIDRGQWWKALSLGAIGAWIHQIGMVFFAGVLFIFIQWVMKEKGRICPSRSDWVVVVLALAALAGQVLYVLHFWSLFWLDINSATSESFQNNIVDRFFFSNKTPWLAVYAGLVGLGLCAFRRLLVPVVLGGCAYVSMLIRPQMWYEIYNQMAFMWLTLTISWTLCWGAEWLLTTRAGGWKRWRTNAVWVIIAFGAGLLPMMRICYDHGFVTGPNNYPAKLGWGWGMKIDSQPYITEQDIQIITQQIEKHVVEGKKHRVFFMPEGDALFFHGRMPSNTIPYQGVYTKVKGDMAVFRLSRHQPNWMRDQHLMKYLRIYGGEGLKPFYERDVTEKWIFIPPTQE